MATARSKPLPRTPSARNAERDRRSALQTEAQQQRQARLETLKNAAAIVAATAEGKLLLRQLHELCGRNVNKAARRYEQGAGGALVLVDVLPNATIYNAARESIWLDFRVLFDKRQLKNIEG